MLCALSCVMCHVFFVNSFVLSALLSCLMFCCVVVCVFEFCVVCYYLWVVCCVLHVACY